MKGCFSSPPSRPTSPASLELMLWPVSEDTALRNITERDLLKLLTGTTLKVAFNYDLVWLCALCASKAKQKRLHEEIPYRCWSPCWPAGPDYVPGSSPTGCWWQWCQTPASPPRTPTAGETPAGRGLPLWENMGDDTHGWIDHRLWYRNVCNLTVSRGGWSGLAKETFIQWRWWEGKKWDTVINWKRCRQSTLRLTSVSKHPRCPLRFRAAKPVSTCQTVADRVFNFFEVFQTREGNNHTRPSSSKRLTWRLLSTS